MRFWNRLLVLIWFVCIAITSCGSSSHVAKGSDAELATFFHHLQDLVANDELDEIKNMIAFPLQTLYWIDGDDSISMEEKQQGLMSEEDYEEYKNDLFYEPVWTYMPQASETEVRQINVASSGSYYKELQQKLDVNSPIYEYYRQYTLDGKVDGDFFAFVFGKVNGQYKIVGYYSKWPVMGE
ncbi:hypothetical protein [Olivibacter sitiensis]|uniref:hypothetical protein n=1 Tax=Olivibacter sitiensis TaxID=376470 RepID=UPI000401C479|nr:hypothetical protein [Olivibacter sitiensis]